MLIKGTAYNNPDIEKAFQDAVDKMSDFFESLDYQEPSLIFLENREIINAFFGRKTEEWVVGNCHNGTIALLIPENYEKESCHEYSKERYIKLIHHEVCHYFHDQLVCTYKPRWLGEGLAVYLSDQYKDKPIPEKFTHFLKFYDDGGPEIYAEVGFVIKLLLDNYGKEKLLKFVMSFNENDSEKNAKESFERVYDKPLNYETFNTLLKK